MKGKGQYKAPVQADSPWGWQTQAQLKVEHFDPQVLGALARGVDC